MFHMAAFSGLSVNSGNLELLPAVIDGWAQVQNNRFVLQEETPLIAGASFGSSMNRSQIFCENFRRVAPLELAPIATSYTANSIMAMPFFPPAGKNLCKLSALEARYVATNPNDSFQIYAWFGLTPAKLANPDVYTIRLSQSIVTVAHVWKPEQLSILDNIPYGRYQVVGCFAHASVGGAIRFRFREQGMLPGTIVSAATAGFQIQDLRRGGMGVWGEFLSTQPPTVEVLSATSGTRTYTIYLDVIRLS